LSADDHYTKKYLFVRINISLMFYSINKILNLLVI